MEYFLTLLINNNNYFIISKKAALGTPLIHIWALGMGSAGWGYEKQMI